MDPEKGMGVGAAENNQAPAPQTAPSHSSFGVASNIKNDGFVGFKEQSSFNFAVLITWLAAAFSILAVLFFWWMNRNLTDSLSQKTTEEQNIIQQITSQGDTEKKANDFKLSVNQLKSAYAEKYSFTAFTTQFYTKITNDVILTNMAIAADGTLSISGTTTTYRSVADLMVAMKSWDSLTNIDLLSVATSVESGKVETTFSISAKIDKTKQKSVLNSGANTSNPSGGTSGAPTSEGGNNAKI